MDLSLQTLAQDLIRVAYLVRQKMGWEEMPPCVLVGHSLGGAVVAEVAKSGELRNRLLGFAVLDVVEGT